MPVVIAICSLIPALLNNLAPTVLQCQMQGYCRESFWFFQEKPEIRILCEILGILHVGKLGEMGEGGGKVQTSIYRINQSWGWMYSMTTYSRHLQYIRKLLRE